MAGLIDPNDIAKARQSGYSDSEITSFLADKHPDQFKAARDAGYDDKEILTHLTDSNTPSGVGAGFAHGVSELAKGTGETLKQFAGIDTGLDGSKTAPADYHSAPIIREGGHFYKPADYNLKNIPQALAEQAPGIAQDVAIGGAVGKVNKWAGVAAGVGSTLLRTLGPMAKENAVARTGNADAEPTAADKARALATATAQAPLNAVGLGRVLPGVTGKVAGVGLEGAGNALKKYLTTVGTESATGAGRDVVGQVGSTIGTDKGVQYDPNKTAEAAITSGAGGGLLVAPRFAGDVKNASKFREFGGDNAEASTALANRINAAADGKKLVSSLGSTKTAAEAVGAAHSDIQNELRTASKDETLSADNTNTLKRINDGGKASTGELDALSQEASPATMNLARQALLASKLKGMGEFTGDKFNGGLSGIMEQKLRPLYNPTATLASMGAAAAGHGGALGMIGMSAPGAVAGVYGSYAAARALDKLTGARSPAEGFTNKFADPSVPIRAPEPQAPPQAPVSTSVPQVAPPQNTALWGNPAEPVPNLRPTLNANAKVEEGMAKIAKQLAAEKQKSMIADAMPDLQRLAQTAQPAPAPAPVEAPTPNLSPVAMMMLKQKLKQGLPDEAPPASSQEVQPTGGTPDAFDALRPLMGRQRAVMRGLSTSSKQQVADNVAQRKAAGIAQAEGLANDSPLINEQGGVSALGNPEFTKRGSQLISAANVMRKLTAQPEETAPVSTAPASPAISQLMQKLQGNVAPTAAPPAPAQPPAMAGNSAPTSMADILANVSKPQAPPAPPIISKIMKKAGKPVEAQQAPPEDQPYAPLQEGDLWRKSLDDSQVASKELESYSPIVRTKYSKNVMDVRDAKRTIAEDVAGDYPADAAVLSQLYHQLDHISRRNAAKQAIKHYSGLMSPEAASALKERFNDKAMSKMWKSE